MNTLGINPNFQGKRNRIDEYIAVDNNTLYQEAYLRTAKKFNHKKERKVSNALFYSAPVAAGLAAAVLSKDSASRLFTKDLSGLAGRAAKGLKTGAFWIAALAAIDLLGFAKNKMSNKSSEVRKFDKEHPFISFGLLLAAGYGMVSLVNRGAVKLAGIKKVPEFLKKGTQKAADFLNNNKHVNNVKKSLLKIADKTPPCLKDIGATLLDWAPTMLLLGGLFNSIGSAGRQSREFLSNYSQLKDRHDRIKDARLRELQLQNDMLMQFEDNQERVRLVNDSLANLPDDVLEKIR